MGLILTRHSTMKQCQCVRNGSASEFGHILLRYSGHYSYGPNDHNCLNVLDTVVILSEVSIDRSNVQPSRHETRPATSI